MGKEIGFVLYREKENQEKIRSLCTYADDYTICALGNQTRMKMRRVIRWNLRYEWSVRKITKLIRVPI